MNLFKSISILVVLALLVSVAPPPASAGQDILATATKDVSSASTDQSSDWLQMRGNHASLVIEGAGTATVTLQYCSSLGGTVTDVATITTKGPHAWEDRARGYYRATIKSGALSGGSVTMTMEMHP